MDIPTSISLIPYCGVTWYQGDEGDCSESALYNSLLQLTNVAGVGTKINPQFAYQTTLDLEGHPNDDHGTANPVMFLAAEIKGLQLYAPGQAYGLSTIGTQPTDAAYTDALTHKIISTTNIPINTQIHYLGVQIADGLNHMQSEIVGFNLYSNFESGSTSNTGTFLGGHAANAVKYSWEINPTDGQYHDYIWLQSWGDAYGDHGLFKLDMESMKTSDFLSIDTINGFNGTNWSGDENSLIIAELYNSILGRSPELAAFCNCSAALSGGMSVESLAASLLASGEGQLKLPSSMTNGQFVTALFWSIQGRAPAAVGLAFWASYLDGGGSRTHLVTEMITQTQDATEWAYNLFVGTNQVLRTASDFLYDRALVSEDLALHMRDAGISTIEKGLLSSVLNSVTSDPNSVQAALVGVATELNHVNLT